MAEHVEFPPLTQEAEGLLLRIEQALRPGVDRKGEAWGPEERTLTAAVIRKAMRQVEPAEATERQWRLWLRLEGIADNLHSPPRRQPLRKCSKPCKSLKIGGRLKAPKSPLQEFRLASV